MSKCIFCLSETGPFLTREHILPESLGGGDWAILPDGYFCDACQNRFGSAIEQQALNDYPFSLYRTFMGIPTKKKKAPWFKSWEGVISGSGTPGILGYQPAPIFSDATGRRTKTVLRVLAQPIKPDMICRTLLKMGLELVAAHDGNEVFHERYNEARTYALEGKKKGKWWYFQEEDSEQASRFFTGRARPEEWSDGVALFIENIEDGADVFRLELLYLKLIVPLDTRIGPPSIIGFPEPQYRLFAV